MASDDSKTCPALDDEEVADSEVVPVNKKRKRSIDFTLICYDQSKNKKVKYGMEKAVLASSSKLFNDMFELCNAEANKEELEIHDVHSDLMYKFLQIINGKICINSWPIDLCVDMIDLGQKYSAENVVHTALLKFLGAFSKEAQSSSTTFNSRYGRAAAIKFISLYHRMVKKELIYSSELYQAFLWCLERTWLQWCKRCKVQCTQATITNFIDFESGSFFTGDDVCIAAICIDHLKQGATNVNFAELLRTLSKQKDQQNPQSD